MIQAPRAKRTALFASASWALISAAEGGGGPAVWSQRLHSGFGERGEGVFFGQGGKLLPNIFVVVEKLRVGFGDIYYFCSVGQFPTVTF